MPSSARDLQAKIQAKIDEENQRKSFSTASTGTSSATKRTAGSDPPTTEANSHADTYAEKPSASASATAAACASNPPEPITVTEQDNNESGSHLATCSVHGRSSISSFPEDRLRDKLSSSRHSLGNASTSNPNSQRSLGDTQSSAGRSSTTTRTPDERLRDKIARENNDSGHGSNYSLGTSSHSPGSQRRTQSPYERIREKLTQQGGAGSAADPARHHRPSQVQEIMDFAGEAARANTAGAQRIQGSPPSKADGARDHRVGAFAIQPSSHSGLSNSNSQAAPGESLDLTEDEERWLAEESGHSPSPSSGGDAGASNSSQIEHAPPNIHSRNKMGDVVLVCGMRKNVFIGVVITIAILTIAIVATAVGVVVSSKPSDSLVSFPSAETMPPTPRSQTNPPVPSPTTEVLLEPICENDIVELPKETDDFLDELDGEFGSSVAISRNTAVVGATGCESCRGSAFVYERRNNGWEQVAQLIPLESYAGDSFGKSIDIDGDIIAVGGNCKDEELIGSFRENTGCAHIFVRTAFGWTQEATLFEDDYNIPELSYANSLAIDDGVLVVGEPSGDFQERGQQSGFIYIYERQNDATWVEVAKIRPSDAQDRDQFGSSLDIDEGQIVVGAPRRYSGGAYVFSKQLDSTWLERMKLVPDDASEGDTFGKSVSITQYGRIAVGATGDDDSGFSSGSVYVFEDVESLGNWVETAKLIPDDGSTSDRFGSSVAIFRDTILVGAIGVDDQGENSGAVYSFSFDRSESSWRQTSKMTAPDGSDMSEFGSQIDVFGSTALVAAFANAPGLLEEEYIDTGEVYAVDLLC